MTTTVMWDGEKSNPITMHQGNRQGAFPSPADYKTYRADDITILDQPGQGYHIGEFSFPCPTVADDMLLMARSPLELQTMISITEAYANEEQYKIHPEKTVILPISIQSKARHEHLKDHKPWTLNGENLSVKDEMVHIGINRNLQSLAPTVADRISSGRKALFGLLGAGLYGTSGIPVETSIHIYLTYIRPCTTYGIEALVLTKPQSQEIEMFQRSTLRSLLGLPDRTGIPALYILTGVLPISYIIDQLQLVFLNSLILDGGRLKELIQRQYVMKGPRSKSWISHIKPILRKYSLPFIPDLLETEFSKQQWKEMVKKAILEVATKTIKEDAEDMSTLQYLNHTFSLNKCHDVVSHIKNPREVRRACIKTQMLTGTYSLQTRRVKFRQSNDGTCQLCHEEDEDLVHCLLRCSVTKTIRDKQLTRIMDTVPHVLPNLALALNNQKILLQWIMDHTHPNVSKYIVLPSNCRVSFERATRNLCYAIHSERCTRLCI